MLSSLSTSVSLSDMAVQWRIDELLEEQNMTAYQVAKAAGLEPSTVYKLLKKGDLRHIDADTLYRLSVVFDVELGDLLRVVE